MNRTEFLDAVWALIPGADILTDNDGQIVIYTNLRVNGDRVLELGNDNV